MPAFSYQGIELAGLYAKAGMKVASAANQEVVLLLGHKTLSCQPSVPRGLKV